MSGIRKTGKKDARRAHAGDRAGALAKHRDSGDTRVGFPRNEPKKSSSAGLLSRLRTSVNRLRMRVVRLSSAVMRLRTTVIRFRTVVNQPRSLVNRLLFLARRLRPRLHPSPSGAGQAMSAADEPTSYAGGAALLWSHQRCTKPRERRVRARQGWHSHGAAWLRRSVVATNGWSTAGQLLRSAFP